MVKEIVLSGLISKYHPVRNLSKVTKDWKRIPNENDFYLKNMENTTKKATCRQKTPAQHNLLSNYFNLN